MLQLHMRILKEQWKATLFELEAKSIYTIRPIHHVNKPCQLNDMVQASTKKATWQAQSNLNYCTT